jgi:hypothetical protein
MMIKKFMVIFLNGFFEKQNGPSDFWPGWLHKKTVNVFKATATPLWLQTIIIKKDKLIFYSI